MNVNNNQSYYYCYHFNNEINKNQLNHKMPHRLGCSVCLSILIN